MSVAGVLFSALAISEILQRAQIDLDGQITAARTECEQPYNNRCVTYYTLQASDGSQIGYAAGPNDHSLQRDLPVGTWISKHKWDMRYSLDGQRVADFPSRFYVGVIVFGALVSPIGLRVLSERRSAPNQSLQPTAGSRDEQI